MTGCRNFRFIMTGCRNFRFIKDGHFYSYCSKLVNKWYCRPWITNCTNLARGFKVFYNRRYFLNFRKYLKN
jgi:hypothetical protein